MPNRVLFTCEYSFKSSPAILFEFLIEPTYLGQWFADSAIESNGIYTFIWSGSEEHAALIDSSEVTESKEDYVRYRWDYSDASEYFEFRISLGEVSGTTTLQVTDFCDDDEVDGQKLLWDTQIADLKKIIGA